MTTAHVNNAVVNGSGSVNNEPVVNKKADRKAYFKEYMRNYRAKQSDKPEIPEIKSDNPPSNGNGKVEPGLKSDAQPELNKLDAPAVEQKPTAEEYREKIIPEADAATARLHEQIRAVNYAQELNRQQQQEAAYAGHVAQLFQWWGANGLKNDDAQFLAAHPAVIGELTHYAGQEASKQGLQPNTAEHTERAKEIFFQHVGHLREQVAANAPMPEAPAQGTTPMQETIPPAPPGLFDPAPAPRQKSGRSASIVSAPVSRETPGTRTYEAENDPSKVRLSPQEIEAARVAGISLRLYAENKIKMLQAKARGEIV